MFNILMDNVIRYWLQLVIEDEGEASTTGLGLTVAERLALFYADDGLIASTNTQWLQQALDALVTLFRRIGLETNVAKTKMMTCLLHHTAIHRRIHPPHDRSRPLLQGKTATTSPVPGMRRTYQPGGPQTTPQKSTRGQGDGLGTGPPTTTSPNTCRLHY
jgi:Reverse transcriptase (RNA-dependent DNA polymerase)